MRPHTPLLLSLLCCAVLGAAETTDAPPGDRGIDRVERYPEQLFLHADPAGFLLDVTKPPFNAVGDGRTDCTAAFVAAYDFVLARMDAVPWSSGGPSEQQDYVIWVPHGTYLISDSVVYSGEPRIGASERKRNHWEQVCRIRIVGESRAGSVIRLVDGAAGFDDPTAPKAMLSFAKTGFNNHNANNVVRNLTLDAGRANPGAIGLRFVGANRAELSNLRIRGEAGAIGLQLAVAPTIGWHHDLVIEGFDVGIDCSLASRATSLVLEHVTLRGQREIGLRSRGGSIASVRKLRSENAVPAVVQEGTVAQLCLIDSELVGGAADRAAIVRWDGSLMLRRVRTEGYAQGLLDGTRSLATGELASYRSGSPLPEDAGALDLPIRDLPALPWIAPEDGWAFPDEHGAAMTRGQAEASAPYAAAIASGAPVLAIRRDCRFEGELSIPASLQRIQGLAHELQGTIVVDEPSPQPLVITDVRKLTVILRARRPLVAVTTAWCHIIDQTPAGGAEVFLANAGIHRQLGQSQGAPMRLWARAINSEGKALPIRLERVDAWLLGFKSERAESIFELSAGSQLELVGGTFGVHHQTDYFRCEPGSRLAVVGCTSGFGLDGSERILSEILPAGDRVLFRSSDFDRRPVDTGGRPEDWNIVIPLLGYGAPVPQGP